MKNYIISLKTEIKRREHIQDEFGNKNIRFEFFDAITPNQNVIIAQNLNISIEQLSLTHGEVACLLSHISLWKKAIDEKLDYIAIYEDDVHLGESAEVFLNQSTWIPEQGDVIKLEAFNSHVFVDRSEKFELDGNRKLYMLKFKHVGAAAYILSQHAAKVLLEAVQYNNEGLKPLDHIIFEDYIINEKLKVLQILPALCIQDDRKQALDKRLNSALEQERRSRFKSQTRQKGLKAKIKKELFRVLLQLLKLKNNVLYQRKKVEFR